MERLRSELKIVFRVSHSDEKGKFKKKKSTVGKDAG